MTFIKNSTFLNSTLDCPFRVLQIFATLNRGGAETMIMNIYRNIDRTKIQFDFIVNEDTTEFSYENEILSLGGRIFRVPKYKILNFFSYYRAWNILIKNHPEWILLHGHHTTPAHIYLKVAKRFNRLTIIHSHTSGWEKNLKSQLKFLLRKNLKYKADFLFSCSQSASNWMFGEDNVNVKIINNAIDNNRYIFSMHTREIKRKEFNIDNKFLIGHIGNFTSVKNYPFILEVFNSILKINCNSVLMLIGNNQINPEIKKRVKKMGLEKCVIFTGVRSDIPDLLQAMDIMIFPSKFEGLPVSLIEAQASGLKVIASDTITEEVAITNLVEFVSLDQTTAYWAERLLRYSNGYDRKDTSLKITQAGYNVKKNIIWLQDFYMKEYQKSK